MSDKKSNPTPPSRPTPTKDSPSSPSPRPDGGKERITEKGVPVPPPRRK